MQNEKIKSINLKTKVYKQTKREIKSKLRNIRLYVIMTTIITNQMLTLIRCRASSRRKQGSLLGISKLKISGLKRALTILEKDK